jgi:ABC-type antimicrobial peptide transport system permease subunit
MQLLRGAIPGLASAEASLYVGASIFLLAASAASVWLPARRASRVDPLRALRQS